MIIEFEGRQLQFDRRAIGVDEWRELKRKYKMTPKTFEDSISEADPDASTFLYWVLLRQNGEPNTLLGDHLKPDIVALNEALFTAEPDEDEEDQEDGEDPTPPSPPSRSPARSASRRAPRTPPRPSRSSEEGVSGQPTGS